MTRSLQGALIGFGFIAEKGHVPAYLSAPDQFRITAVADVCAARREKARQVLPHARIYADTKTGPVLAFHMWTEVWVKGQWTALDATLGRGYVGATHLKITDHSWHETQSLTPMLPLLRVLGKVSVEVVSVQ